MKQRIVLLGPPASGKGTQAELLTEKYHLPVTSPGAILREERRAGTARGVEAEQLTSKGLLLPDELIVDLVRSWLAREDGQFVFDGFPRTLGQAEALEGLLSERGTPLDAVIALEAEVATLQARVARRIMCVRCGRSFSVGLHVAHPTDPCPVCGGTLARRTDDTPEALQIRLIEYREKTEPLVDYYEQKGLLHRVNSSEQPEVVFEAIRAILEG